MTRKTLNIAIAAALLGTLALAGCKKDQDEAAMTTPPATTEPVPAPMPEPAPAPASSASVTAVDLGNTIGADMKVGAPSTTFAPSDTIYASVSTNTSDPAASVPGTLKATRSEEHTSELQSLMRISYAVFCLQHKKQTNNKNTDK